MDFKDEIKLLGDRVEKLKDSINTEEATKNALIMPFLKALGYDVFNPLEVVPEYITDIGTKKGEKIDYAIMKDGHTAILIECKHWKENLNIHDGQLLRYFHVSKAKFSILTNGILYRFYTDLEKENIMDEKPFLEINISDIRENQFEELKKFHKSYFDVESIISSASELKYTNELKQLISAEFNNPSPDFVKFFAKQTYNGKIITEKVLEKFTQLIKKSFSQYISDILTDRLKNALKRETDEVEQRAQPLAEQKSDNESKIDTTVEEMESYYIVKSILRNIIDTNRIFHRDAQSYFSVILDDSNRKPICRIYLNGSKKYLGIFDATKKETKVEIVSIDDIYNYAENLTNTISSYNLSETD